MKRFDKIVLAILGGLLGLILILVLIGSPGAFQVELIPSGTDDPIGVYGPVQLQFQQDMEKESVEKAFKITPQVEGVFIWDERTLAFFSLSPFDPGTKYSVELQPGALSASGQESQKTRSWDVTIRPPDILYLQLQEVGGELWLWDSPSQAVTPLTETEGAILDYAVSRSGQQIAYSKHKVSGGSDLWIMNRNGDNLKRVLDCGSDLCDQPAFSLDATWIAYARNAYDAATSLYEPSRIWTVNVETGETAQLYQSEFAFGHSPSFSPDGEKLASYDTTQNAIRILDLNSSQESALPSVNQEYGDWSQDGKKLMYTDLLPSTLEPDGVIYIADLVNQTISQPLREEVFGTSISQPRWSPDGNWMAVAIRPVNRWISKALWIFKLDGSEAFPIADEPSATFSAYQWNPTGGQLVYQRLATGSDLASSIWLWDWESGESEMLVEDGARPQWLP
jgi:TolB protein